MQSRKSRRPVKSIALAENLASGETIYEGKFLVDEFNEILSSKIDLSIVAD